MFLEFHSARHMLYAREKSGPYSWVMCLLHQGRSIEVMGGSESKIVEEPTLAFARNTQYGQLDDVFDFSFSTSTNTCVKKSRSEFINSGSFRGTDFDCRFNECRCLYVKVLWIASTTVALT